MKPRQETQSDTLDDDGWIDPVIEVYKRDVDRTLFRENLKLTPHERLLKLQDFLQAVTELRGSARIAGSNQ